MVKEMTKAFLDLLNKAADQANKKNPDEPPIPNKRVSPEMPTKKPKKITP